MEITKERRRHFILVLRENGETLDSIGKVFGLSRERIRQIINEGESNPSELVEYRKPKHNKFYGLEGRDYKREMIREHFNYTCQMCGRVWHEGERKFDVHHLSCRPEDSRKYDKKVDFKAVTLLCHKCHMSLPEHRIAMMKPHLHKKVDKKLDK